jgi:hypothetical protein
MAGLFSGLFFALALLGALGLMAALLRAEWPRVIAILSGSELRHALGATPQVRIRTRAWRRAELRPVPRASRAAA